MACSVGYERDRRIQTGPAATLCQIEGWASKGTGGTGSGAGHSRAGAYDAVLYLAVATILNSADRGDRSLSAILELGKGGLSAARQDASARREPDGHARAGEGDRATSGVGARVQRVTQAHVCRDLPWFAGQHVRTARRHGRTCVSVPGSGGNSRWTLGVEIPVT